jgi:hypothetical protein
MWQPMTVPVTLTAGVLFFTCAVVQAQHTERLETKEQRQPFLAKVEASPEFKELSQAKKDPRLVVANVVKYTIDEGKDKSLMVEVLHFKYEGGVTIRSLYDVRQEKVVKVEPLHAYPTPLAGEEVKEAIRLAKEQSRQVRELYPVSKGPETPGKKDQPTVEALAPVISDPERPNYAHRLVLLTFIPRSEKTPSVSVQVDLTDKKVIQSEK